MFCWFTALPLIPLADFTAISFTAPMFLTVLAMLFLGERIHGYRWTALIVGLLGVLITIGPHVSFGGNTMGIALAFGAAMFSALAMLFLRSMSGSGGEHAITITFYFSAFVMVAGGVTAIAGWPMPTPQQWFVIVLAGFFGVFGQLLMTFSYRYAEVSTIAPLDYTNLLFAVAFGYYLFAEVPHWSMWVGAPLVIAAGLIILWREYRGMRRRPHRSCRTREPGHPSRGRYAGARRCRRCSRITPYATRVASSTPMASTLPGTVSTGAAVGHVVDVEHVGEPRERHPRPPDRGEHQQIADEPFAWVALGELCSGGVGLCHSNDERQVEQQPARTPVDVL
jgi:drug/metabolite transporter (DMT)-like permease